MKRSKSALTQKTNKKELKPGLSKGDKAHVGLKGLKQLKVLQNPPSAQRPNTSRNAFEERLSKIKQGFQDLEKNLNWNNFNGLASPEIPITSPLTSRKVAKRLFNSENTRKKTNRTAKNQPQKASKKLTSPVTSPARDTPKNSSKFHTCVYERSLFDLMKIIVVQKQQIVRLNLQIKGKKKK